MNPYNAALSELWYHLEITFQMPVPRTGNKFLALLLLIPLAATAVVLGIFFFALALAVVSVLLAVLFVRLWWLRRKLQKTAPASVLEGEFRVITPKSYLRADDERAR